MFDAINNSTQYQPTDWYRLRLFGYFRGALALFFIALYLNGWLQQLVPAQTINAGLYIITTTVYLVASSIIIFLISQKRPGLGIQVVIQTIIDITIIILLMHATGGIRSGLGMLLIISTSMTSLFLKRRLTLLFAATATLSLMVEQVFSSLSDTANQADFTQAGLLGLLIFVSALLTTYIAKHLHESEQIARDKSRQLESVVQMNEQIIHKMRTGILVLSANGSILMSNNAATELLGNTKIQPQALLKNISPTLHNRFLQWSANKIQNHQPINQPNGLPDIQPGFSQVNQSSRDDSKTLVFLEDANLLGQRFQQVKLASLGRLTASIAHEIRNPLAAINHASQLLEESNLDIADKKLTHIIHSQTGRLNRIVENVLQLSRQQRGHIEAVKLLNWLQQFREEFHRTQGLHAYQMPIQIQPESLTILFDPGQLHQVLWNLCTNSLNHANHDKTNIMINIRGGIDTEQAQPYIDIIDNGPGIDESTQSHIFEPFFTTHTKGTGLGLYITREIVETNRAKIRYINLPAGGTCFRIYFMQATDAPLPDFILNSNSPNSKN